MNTPLAIRIESLSKRYVNLAVLDDISLDVRPGEFLTLLGPSGSGKTTLLMAIAGFVRPDAGHIYVEQQDMVRLPPNKRDIGVVFQNYALFPHMSVLENVVYPLSIRRVAKPEARRRAMDALALVQVESMADRTIAALSGGQRQRVALARAMVFRPRLMLMDEPLSALDKNLRELMQFEIRRLHDQLGITTIYVTHDQREALTMSDRIAVMRNGKIEQIDTPEQIYLRPGSPFVAEFMGEANILPASDATFRGIAPPSTAKLMVRAESLRIGPGTDEDVSIAGLLLTKAFRGENWLARLQTPSGHEVMLNIPAMDAQSLRDLMPGSPFAVAAPRAMVHVFGEDAK